VSDRRGEDGQDGRKYVESDDDLEPPTNAHAGLWPYGVSEPTYAEMFSMSSSVS
jgi:hypothetical protein